MRVCDMIVANRTQTISDPVILGLFAHGVSNSTLAHGIQHCTACSLGLKEIKERNLNPNAVSSIVARCRRLTRTGNTGQTVIAKGGLWKPSQGHSDVLCESPFHGGLDME